MSLQEVFSCCCQPGISHMHPCPPQNNGLHISYMQTMRPGSTYTALIFVKQSWFLLQYVSLRQYLDESIYVTNYFAELCFPWGGGICPFISMYQAGQGFKYFGQSRSREIQVNPRNPAKFTKMREIPRNWEEILSDTCLYNLFETYFSYWGYLLAKKLQIYLRLTLSLKCANNIRLCCEKLGTSHDVKGFTIGSFVERIVVKRANDDLCQKIPRNLTFSSATCQKPWQVIEIIGHS